MKRTYQKHKNIIHSATRLSILCNNNAPNSTTQIQQDKEIHRVCPNRETEVNNLVDQYEYLDILIKEEVYFYNLGR